MPRDKRTIASLVHAGRVAVVFALLWLLPSPRHLRTPEGQTGQPPALNAVQDVLPEAAGMDSQADSAGLWAVRDADNRVLARVGRTLPAAERVIGYRGPSEALIVVDDEDRMLGVRLIGSADTREHVAAVRKDAEFFEQFRTWTWQGPPPEQSIDAVSGATLTSLALAKGVLRRIGGDRPSLVFPEPVSPEELQPWFPQVASVATQGDLLTAKDAAGKTLGHVVRTGPLVDDVIGYQGPTELLIRLAKPRASDARDFPEADSQDDAEAAEATWVVEDIKIRSSFDNQPYVRYCRMEAGYWAIFEGQTVAELAAMDPEAAGVEGVSGATMTSLAIADTLVAAADKFRISEAARRTARQQGESWASRFVDRAVAELTALRWTAADLACLVMLAGIPVFRALGWFRRRWLRRGWLLTAVIVIGFWSGNLISMALVAGWSAEGVAWQLAPALAAVAAVAFLSPAAGKSNPYCNHLCPHGALQQLIRPHRHSRRHWQPPARLVKAIAYLPGTLLVAAYLTLLIAPATDLSSWEPFHAYLFRIAPWSAVVLAVVTLMLAARIPMAYCRLGCPTGRLLDHLRRSANSHRLGPSDVVAFALLLLALGVRWAGGS